MLHFRQKIYSQSIWSHWMSLSCSHSINQRNKTSILKLQRCQSGRLWSAFRTKNHFLVTQMSTSGLADWATFRCLGDFIIVCGHDFLAQMAHIFGLFLIQCHFSSESILGNFLQTFGILFTQAFWSLWTCNTDVANW